MVVPVFRCLEQLICLKINFLFSCNLQVCSKVYLVVHEYCKDMYPAYTAKIQQALSKITKSGRI